MKTNNKTQATVARKARRPPSGEWSLYFLPDDPGEQHDLADERPEQLQLLRARLEQLIAAGRSRPTN